MAQANPSFSLKERKEMNFSMRLSFVVGFFMLIVKVSAYILTGSAAILSDAAESVIHVFAVGFATYSMWLSLKPADKEHLYGHEKIEFFSSGFEGALITIAAFYILYESIYKIVYGFEIERIGLGFIFTAVVMIINFFLAFFLINKGKKYKSIVLEANGKHILTDCWTSVAVLIALGLVKLTNIPFFDPAIAILAALSILWTGWRLIKKSVGGLMDKADLSLGQKIVAFLDQETKQRGLCYHHLRHRLSGHKIFIEFHLMFPNNISLIDAHEIASEVEKGLKDSLDRESDILTHLEPQEKHDQIHKDHGLPI